MAEQMNKRFIRVAAVLFLLLLVVVGAGQELRRGMAEEQGEKDPMVKSEISEASGREDEISLKEELGREGSASDEYVKELEVYREVLEEYAQAIREDEDEVYVAGKWKYVYDLLYSAGKRRGILYYSLENMSNHDNRELIMGIFEEGEYIPYIVYGDWGDGIVELCRSEAHEMRIYEGGTIELRLGGIYYSVICYYRLGEKVTVEDLEEEVQEDGEVTVYTREIFLDRYGSIKEEITEEEYLEIIGRYTAVPVDLEWMPLEGFR